MHRALGLLLLAAEGALAQSREPSNWDDNVPGYSSQAISWTANGTEVTCPCNSTGELSPTMDCRPTNEPAMNQTHTSTLEVTWTRREPVKFAYLTDQDGTIISYRDGGWDSADKKSKVMTFSWDNSSKQPTMLVPHIVYEESCADVFPSVAKQTWRTKLALLSEEYDVGNSADGGVGAAKCPKGTPCVPTGTPTISVTSDIILADDWFKDGGTATADFHTDGVGGADTNALWLTNQDGTIIFYKEQTASMPFQMGKKQFPRGTVELHACRLFKTKKLCATASLVDKYITKIDDLTPPATEPAYSATDKAFTDLFTGHFDSAAERTSIGPKDSNCTQYVIYAKKLDNTLTYAFAFDKPLHFAADNTTKYKVTLTCDGTKRVTGTMDLAIFDRAILDLAGTSTFSLTDEVKVGSPRCLADHDDHDGHDHAEGAEEEEGYKSDNTTWFQHEGRDCMCDKGTLRCKRAGAGSPFSMNEGETVGLVIAVSAIVFICIAAIIFFGFSFLLKKKQKNDKGVVLQSDGDRL